MTEWAAIGAISALAGFGISFSVFWLTFGGRIGKAETEAAEALNQAKEANDKVAIQTAAFSLHREHVAREYIHREVMREVEDRLTAAIDRLGDRLDRFTEATMQRN